MKKSFYKIKNVNGKLVLPGDKSISHRAVIFSSMANGKSSISNLSAGNDVKSTIDVMKMMGTSIKYDNDLLTIDGCGFKGFKKPTQNLDCGNSGTSARLIAGLLSAQNYESVLIGDDSLSKRPMKRVIEPLEKMGANFIANKNYTLPLTILPSDKIKNIEYEMPISSAQVKSSVLIAGLHNELETAVIEKQQTRDHTERMLGLPINKTDDKIIAYSSTKYYPQANEYFIPGDISTAAFHIVLALLTPNSELVIENASLNPTRIGFINILKQMGANIKFENVKLSNNEEYGDVIAKSSSLKNISINEQIIPNIIDEIPILSIAGIFAEGDFEINNVEELRFKESDRIKSICDNLKLLGLSVEETQTGFSFSGTVNKRRPVFGSYNDHRIAMSFSILSLLLEDGGEVNNYECVSISNPQFDEQIKSIIN